MPVRPPTFRPKYQRTRREANTEYDRHRGSARERGYDARWDVAALSFRREHPLCLGCEAVGRVEPATCVDHVIPHKGDMVRFWDRGKWQSACDWHHDTVKQQLERLYEQGKAKVADLWLDSEKAKELTRSLRG